jgi:iron-sulfur cluster assembly protein
MKHKQIIEISQIAAEKVKELISMREVESFGVRISVKSGGCSGLSYVVEYADTPRPFEEIVQDMGVRILIDPKAIMYVIGSRMDYVEDTFKSGFIFINPNEKAQCGCGKSFNV